MIHKNGIFPRNFLKIKIFIMAGLGGMDSLFDDQMAGMKMKIRVMSTSARIVCVYTINSEELVLAYK